jgi:hypothetical protein
MRNTLLFVLLLFTALLSAQTIEKSQSIMIFDVVPTVAPCTFCSERAFVRADNTEYYWDGDSWEKWYDGNAYLTALVQDSIIVTTRFGVEVDRDTVRVAGMGGGSPGLADSMLVVRDSLAAIRGDIGTGGGGTPAIDTLDVLVPGQSNIVGTDFTIGDWTYEIDSSVFAFQYDDATFEVATPSNITREVYTADRNNIGWAFAKAYRKTHPNTVVRIMVSADGGKSVTNWTPTVEASPYESNEMLDSIAQKLARAPVDFLADVIIWHQGESDAIAASTPDNFQYLWAGRLMEVYDTLVGFSKISDTAPMIIGWVSYEFNTINAQIDSVNTGKYNLGGRPILATQKFGALNTVETGFTRTHYTNESIDIIGGLYANRLEGQSVETENLPQNWLRYGTWAKKYVGVDSHLFTGNTSGDSISRYQLDFGALGSVLRGYNATGANAFTLRSYATANIQQELASGGLSILTGDIVMENGGLNITGPYMRISNDGVNDFIDMLNGGSRSWIIRAYSSSGVQAELLQGALLMAGGGIRFTDNLYDIGALGATRPRTGYFGTSLYSPTIIGGNSVVQKLTFQTSSGSATTGSDIIFKDNDTEWVRILNNGAVGIGTATPSASSILDLTSTTRGFLPPRMTTAQRDAIATPATGLQVVNTTTGELNMYNGSSWIAVATGALMSNWTLAADTGTPASITNATTATIAGSAEGIDVAMSGNTATVSLDYSEVTATTTLGGNEFFQLYDVTDGNRQTHIDTLARYLVGSGLFDFNSSAVLPDSLISILTTDGAGIEFFSDYVNLVGTEVLANGQVIPMNDTLVVPVYAHAYDAAISTGSGYRGWRVPSDLDGARLIGVHYSFQTPGSDTVLIQLGNGVVNIFGATIPATGYITTTAVRTLAADEIWIPNIGTINGAGHQGLMMNLIIERNR